MKHCILYSTLGCHLCEDAKQLLEAVGELHDMSWQEQDIIEDDNLVEAYGIRIPVLKSVSTEAELGWPFDLAALSRWLETQA